VLRDVVSHSDTLALRFKDVSSKQTVPVENEFQPQFDALLAHAAADSAALQHGRCVRLLGRVCECFFLLVTHACRSMYVCMYAYTYITCNICTYKRLSPQLCCVAWLLLITC